MPPEAMQKRLGSGSGATLYLLFELPMIEENSAPPPETLRDMLARWSMSTPAADALIGVDPAPMSYAALGEQMSYVSGALRSSGLSRGDRIATVLPDGP